MWPTFPNIRLTVEEKPGKNLNLSRKSTQPGIEPERAAWKTTMLPFDHGDGLGGTSDRRRRVPDRFVRRVIGSDFSFSIHVHNCILFSYWSLRVMSRAYHSTRWLFCPYKYNFVSVYMCALVFLYMRIYLCLCVCVCVCMCVCMCVCVYIWGFRARQHLRSLAPVMNDEWWW